MTLAGFAASSRNDWIRRLCGMSREKPLGEGETQRIHAHKIHGLYRDCQALRTAGMQNAAAAEDVPFSGCKQFET